MADSQGRGIAARIAVIAVALLACFHGTMAMTYQVGDTAGWNLNVDYKTWASQHSFQIGDILLFKYSPETHSVFQTTEANYISCNTAGRLQAYQTGSDTVTITNSTMYFICPTPNHCSAGMALAITASGTPVTPTSGPAPLSSPPSSHPTASPSPAPAGTSRSPSSSPAPASKSPSPSPASHSPSQPSPSPSPSAPTSSPSSPESSPSSSPSGSPSETSSPSSSPPSPPSPPSAASALRSGSIVLLSSVLLTGLLSLL